MCLIIVGNNVNENPRDGITNDDKGVDHSNANRRVDNDSTMDKEDAKDVPGTGKSCLAEALVEKTGLKWINVGKLAKVDG